MSTIGRHLSDVAFYADSLSVPNIKLLLKFTSLNFNYFSKFASMRQVKPYILASVSIPLQPLSAL